MSARWNKILRPTLAFKLGLWVLASTSLIFLIAFVHNNQAAQELMLRGVRENTKRLAENTVNRIENVLQGVEKIPRFVAYRMAEENSNTNQIVQMLMDILLANPQIYGAALAFEPNQVAPGLKAYAPYVYRHQSQVRQLDLGTGAYDYFSQDWYLIPKELGKPVWSEPYFDEGGGETMMCTFSVPFSRQVDGRSVFAGVVTANVQLEQLVQMVSTISLFQSGYAFLLSQNGQIISHPHQSWVFKESLFSLADEFGATYLRDIGEAMVRGREGFERIQSLHRSQMCWLYYAPVTANGWSVGIIFPEKEILADLHALNREVLWIGTIGFGLLLCVVVFLANSVTRPIRSLAHQTQEIAKGNLDVQLPPIKSHDEVEELSHSFENMRVALKEYIVNLADTTAAKERIESELKIARSIQRSFLPKRFPPFPETRSFDVYADLLPAKEVGGDLYDFFLLDDQHLFFSIGDVSDKGVPAALLMAVTKTLMKGVAEQHLSPSEILFKVNHELALDNEAMMFVTLFCGILNLQTGELRYTNAGHLPPILIRDDQRVSWLELPDGMVLGVMEDSTYKTRTITLQPKDTLLLYTDGVTEAMNPKLDLFGEDRLLDLIQSHGYGLPKALVETVLQSIHKHAEGAQQSDDVTVLALQFKPEPRPKTT
jgi:sigma-B regulation protein RsbU (phosphoserine phosphatase)